VIAVPPELEQAFADSMYGAPLVKPFPIGNLHRGTLHELAAWQQKFHPDVKRRKPKHRKRK
jgi:hypothetical protein